MVDAYASTLVATMVSSVLGFWSNLELAGLGTLLGRTLTVSGGDVGLILRISLTLNASGIALLRAKLAVNTRRIAALRFEAGAFTLGIKLAFHAHAIALLHAVPLLQTGLSQTRLGLAFDAGTGRTGGVGVDHRAGDLLCLLIVLLQGRRQLTGKLLELLVVTMLDISLGHEQSPVMPGHLADHVSLLQKLALKLLHLLKHRAMRILHVIADLDLCLLGHLLELLLGLLVILQGALSELTHLRVLRPLLHVACGLDLKLVHARHGLREAPVGFLALLVGHRLTLGGELSLSIDAGLANLSFNASAVAVLLGLGLHAGGVAIGFANLHLRVGLHAIGGLSVLKHRAVVGLGLSALGHRGRLLGVSDRSAGDENAGNVSHAFHGRVPFRVLGCSYEFLHNNNHGWTAAARQQGLFQGEADCTARHEVHRRISPAARAVCFDGSIAGRRMMHDPNKSQGSGLLSSSSVGIPQLHLQERLDDAAVGGHAGQRLANAVLGGNRVFGKSRVSSQGVPPSPWASHPEVPTRAHSVVLTGQHPVMPTPPALAGPTGRARPALARVLKKEVGTSKKSRAVLLVQVYVRSDDMSSRMTDYAAIVERTKDRHHLRIRRWRRSMSGCAWRVYFTDGRVINWIESPYPKTPISLAIFLHEVGHHVIGFDRYKRRCEEEYHAWVWALSEMRRLGVEPDVRVRRRFDLSMRYAVDKAMRRGIKHLPAPLDRFLPAAA
jgi:hypothetical protein